MLPYCVFFFSVWQTTNRALKVARESAKQYPDEPWFLFFHAAYDMTDFERSYSALCQAVDLARASGGIIPSVFLFELGRHAMLCQRWKAGSDAYEEFLHDNREYAQVAHIRVTATLLGMYEQGDPDISPTITRLRSLFSSAIINQLHTKLWGHPNHS